MLNATVWWCNPIKKPKQVEHSMMYNSIMYEQYLLCDPSPYSFLLTGCFLSKKTTSKLRNMHLIYTVYIIAAVSNSIFKKHPRDPILFVIYSLPKQCPKQFWHCRCSLSILILSRAPQSTSLLQISIIILKILCSCVLFGTGVWLWISVSKATKRVFDLQSVWKCIFFYNNVLQKRC